MAASQPGWFNFFALTNLSDLADGYRLYTYTAATTTHKIAYTDPAGTISHTYTSDGSGGLYIALDARGEIPAPLFLTTGGYDLTLKTAAGATVWNRRAYGQNDGSDAIRADLASSADVAKGDALIGVKLDVTGGVARTQHDKNAELVSAKDFGAVGDGVANDTVALQAFLTYCYTYTKAGHVPAGTYLTNDLNVQITGGRLNGSLKIYGDGINASIIKQKATAVSHVLRLYGASAPSPNTVSLILEDLAFHGPDTDASNNSVDGLVLEDIAGFHIRNVCLDAFNVGVHLKSALIGEFYGCVASASKINLKTTRSAASGAYCNNILWSGGQINYALTRGVDLGYANGITFDNVDIERNCADQVLPSAAVTISNATPAVVTWAAHGLAGGDPVILTTTGVLPAPLVVNKVYYAISDTSSTIRLSTTVGGSDIGTTTAGSGTHTARSPNKGAVAIRNTCITELGYSFITFNQCWIEGNGISGIVSEYMSDAFGLTLSINGGHLLGDGSSNQDLVVGLARAVSIADWNCVAGASLCNISSDKLTLKNTYLINLARPAVTSTIAENCIINGADWNWGEPISFTGTLTGCTTSPTGTLIARKQGNQVTLKIPEITGTSNTAAATITGAPASLYPSAAFVIGGASRNNGTELYSSNSIGTDGVITLGNGFTATFTASGTKGVSQHVATYFTS